MVRLVEIGQALVHEVGTYFVLAIFMDDTTAEARTGALSGDLFCLKTTFQFTLPGQSIQLRRFAGAGGMTFLELRAEAKDWRYDSNDDKAY